MIMPRNGNSSGFLLVLVLLTGGGCGGGKDRPVKVDGIVTLDGNPLPGATVTFVTASEGRRPASGLTDADGAFQLTTFKTGDGALPGEYKITISLAASDSRLEAAQGKGLAGMKDYFAAMKSAQGKKAAAAKAASSSVPAIYRDSTRTPLRQVVPAEGKVQVELRSALR